MVAVSTWPTLAVPLSVGSVRLTGFPVGVGGGGGEVLEIAVVGVARTLEPHCLFGAIWTVIRKPTSPLVSAYVRAELDVGLSAQFAPDESHRCHA